MTAVLAINVSLLVAALLSVLVMIDRMSGRTRGAIRWASALLLAGTIAEAVGYLAHWAAWTDTLFFGGCAMCLIANLRFPTGTDDAQYKDWTPEQRAQSERKSTHYAYAVGALTVLGLLVAWVTS